MTKKNHYVIYLMITIIALWSIHCCDLLNMSNPTECWKTLVSFRDHRRYQLAGLVPPPIPPERFVTKGTLLSSIEVVHLKNTPNRLHYYSLFIHRPATSDIPFQLPLYLSTQRRSCYQILAEGKAALKKVPRNDAFHSTLQFN